MFLKFKILFLDKIKCFLIKNSIFSHSAARQVKLSQVGGPPTVLKYSESTEISLLSTFS